jgi:hypothetical protein
LTSRRKDDCRAHRQPAQEDEFISKSAQAEIKAALAGKPNATVYSYPGQNDTFARHNGRHYNAAVVLGMLWRGR